MLGLFDAQPPEDVAEWTVHTDVFEGPLDLLLYLVRRDGIDLSRLVVSQIADAYLDYISGLRRLNLSLAADYLVMAATLVHLKSLELMPRPPTPVDEDEEDPREAFAARLRDYQRYRQVAEQLAARPWLGRDEFARPAPEPMTGEVHSPLGVFALFDVYRALKSQSEAPEPEVRFMDDPGLDLGSAVRGLLAALHRAGGVGELRQVLAALPTRSAQVITFIGVLEMLKLGWVEVEQRDHLGAITLRSDLAPDQIDMAALTGWVEAPAS